MGTNGDKQQQNILKSLEKLVNALGVVRQKGIREKIHKNSVLNDCLISSNFLNLVEFQ